MGYAEFDANLPAAAWLYGRQDESNRWHLVSVADNAKGLCGIRLFEMRAENNAYEAMLWGQASWNHPDGHRLSLCKKCRTLLLEDPTSALPTGHLPVNWRGVPEPIVDPLYDPLQPGSAWLYGEASATGARLHIVSRNHAFRSVCDKSLGGLLTMNAVREASLWGDADAIATHGELDTHLCQECRGQLSADTSLGKANPNR